MGASGKATDVNLDDLLSSIPVKMISAERL